MSGILIAIAIVLVLMVVFLAARTTELLGALKGEGETTDSSNHSNSILLMLFMVLGLGGSVWSFYYYKYTYLPTAASEHGKLIDSMALITSIPILIVFFITQILLFWFAYKYRSRKGHEAMFFSHDNKLEIIWTVIPAIVLTGLVAYGIESWNKITSPAPEGHRLVEMTAEQFAWNIRYPGADGKLGDREFMRMSGTNGLGIVWEDSSSHDDFMPAEIHIEVNKPVLFKLGSKDVLHAFYLAHFRVKMDCVPGIPTQFWFTPTITTDSMRKITGNPKFEYELACAELCGASHWNMRKVLVVETADQYKKWIAEQKPVYDPVAAEKEKEIRIAAKAKQDKLDAEAKEEREKKEKGEGHTSKEETKEKGKEG